MTNNNDRMVTVTLDLPSVSCLKSALELHTKNGFAYISIPIAHPVSRTELFVGKGKNRKGPFAWSDLCLKSH
ncbi:hypothetical protein LSTR_LSTR015418, partial [Laodelphax striatellus]